MRPTPAKARPPTRRSPRRSPNNSTKIISSKVKQSTKSPSSRRSIKRGRMEEQDSLGSPNFALTPVKKRKRDRAVDEDMTTVDKLITKNTPTAMNKNNSSNSGSRSKSVHGRRPRMSPRTHGAAIANSLASPVIDSSFLISNTAPITPSKRSTAESTLNHLARKTKRDRNSTSELLADDNNNNKATVKKKLKKKAPINADSNVEFVPKGKVEERWLKNFNKWKQSMEEIGYQEREDDTAQKLPLPKSWINAQRREYRAMNQNEKSSMTQSKIRLLESAGFTWDAPMGRPKKNNTNNSTSEEAAATTVPNKAASKRLKRNNEQKSSPTSKRTSPRKSRPTQFYHNLTGNDEKASDGKVSMDKTTKQKKDKPREKPKTSKPISNPEVDKCEDDEKAVKSLILLSTSSNEKDQSTKAKAGGKKRRSRGGRQAMSFLSSLETLQSSDASSKKKRASGQTKANNTKDVDAADSTKVDKPKGTVHRLEQKSVLSENENEETNATGDEETTEGEKVSFDVSAKQNGETDPLESNTDDSTAQEEAIAQEVASTGDKVKSPFPSSPLKTSNLECPESGSLSVGHAQNSPAKKKVPESICIRELMMSCLTEEDKQKGENNLSGSTRLRSADESTHKDEGKEEGATKTNDPLINLPNTPIQNKETPTATFSPLSMTSPLRANNLLETSYNEEPEVQDKISTHESRSDSPPGQPAKRRSRNSSQPSNLLVQNESRHVVDVNATTNAEIATQTSERTDEAERLQLIQRERRYREKMTEFGKLELEAKLVAERMRQIEERMRQIESSSIANDLREYDDMKRRASYPDPKRLWRREMIESQHYQSSDDEFSDGYESQRNLGHDGYQRHGDYGRFGTRSKIRSELYRSRTQPRRSSESRRSNTQRRLMENSRIEDDRNRLSAPRNDKRKKRRKKKVRESGQDSMSQVDRTSLKSPYAELRSDDARQKEAVHPNQYPNENLHREKDNSDANIVATSSSKEEEITIPASSSSSAENESKRDSDSTSTKQSSVDQTEERNASNNDSKTTTKVSAKDPLYWLADGDSDSDAESWDLDGPMILPPPPA